MKVPVAQNFEEKENFCFLYFRQLHGHILKINVEGDKRIKEKDS